MWWSAENAGNASVIGHEELKGHWAKVTAASAAPRVQRDVTSEQITQEWMFDERLATGDAAGRVLLWKIPGKDAEPNTGDEFLKVLCGHAEPIRCVAWDPDGARLASAGDDSRVLLWNVGDSDPTRYGILRVLQGHMGSVSAVSWSKAGNRLASTGFDSKVVVWNVTGDEPKKYHRMTVLSGHTAPVRSLHWAPNGERIATGSVDEHVRIWRVKGGDPRRYRSIANLNSQQQFVLEFSLEWIDYLEERLRQMGIVNEADRRRLQITDVNGEIIKLVPLPPEERFPLLFEVVHNRARGHKEAITAITWDPSSTRVASADEDGRIVFWWMEGKIAESYFVQKSVEGHRGEVQCLAWSPDGRYLASGGEDKRVLLWNVEGSNPENIHLARELRRAHLGTVNSLAWQPDCRWFASVGDDCKVLVWEVIGGLPIPSRHKRLGSTQSHSPCIQSADRRPWPHAKKSASTSELRPRKKPLHDAT